MTGVEQGTPRATCGGLVAAAPWPIGVVEGLRNAGLLAAARRQPQTTKNVGPPTPLDNVHSGGFNSWPNGRHAVRVS